MSDKEFSLDFRKLFDMSPTAFMVILPDLTIAAATDQYLRLTMRKREEVVGRYVFEAFPDNPDDETPNSEAVRASFEKVFATGEIDELPVQKYDVERPAEKGGGFEERYWRIVTYPGFNEKGEVAYIYPQVENITEQIRLKKKNIEQEKENAELAIRAERSETQRQAAADALEDARLRLKSALDAGEIGTWTWDPVSDSVVADKNLAEFFSVSKEDANGGKIEKYLSAIYPDDIEIVQKLVADALESRDKYEAEYRLVNPDSSLRWVVARGRVVRDKEGKAIQLPGVVIDITNRKRAEEALQESEQRLKFTLDAGKLGSYHLDIASGEMICSERCLSNFGLLPEADLSFEKFLSMIHDDDRERVGKAVEKAIKDHENYRVEYLIKRGDGKPAWIFASGRCRYDDRGNALVMNGVTLDITSRKQAEEELHESQNRLALALQAGRAGTFVWDIKNNINIWSPELEELYGVPVGTFEGNYDAWAKRVVTEDADAVTKGVEETLARGGKFYDYEFRVIMPDGSHKWFAGRASFEYDADGQPSRMLGINVDITDSKKVQELLVERTKLATLSSDIGIGLNRREELKNLLKYCTDALVKHLDAAFARIWTVDKSGKMLKLQASSGLYTHLDGEHSMIPIGKYKIGRIAEICEPHLTNEVLTDPDVSNKEWAKKENMKAFAGYPLIIEEKLVGVMCVFSKNALTETTLQAMEAVANTIANAIERKRIETNLSESDERFQLVTRATNDAIWDWNLQTNEVWWNNAVQMMFGFAPGQIEPTSDWWYENIHPEDRERVVSGIHEVIDNGGENWSDEYRYRCSDGRYKYVFDRGFAIHRDGQPIRMLGAMQDITEKKYIESEREQLLSKEKNARSEAEQANRMKDEFLATLSHELRTPLSAILGWSRLLRQGQIKPEETGRAIETIERNAKVQAQLIEDVLDVSRIISGKMRLEVQPLDLSGVIEAAIDSVSPAAEAKSIRLQRVMDTKVMISGDADRLQQIIWNLLSNAIKFTPKGGRVQIKLERINSHVEVTVADNGIGISPDTLPFVFERFRQSDSSTTRSHGGLGLGLAIVRHLVELHGGTVQAASEGLNKGAEFILKFPLIALRSKEVSLNSAENDPRVHPTADGDTPFTCPPEIEGLRILLVDDEPDTREMLSFIFETCGAFPKTAAAVEEALEAVKTEKFDILISDIGMPQRDGYDLIKNLRQFPAEQGGRLPAIALTAFARVEDRLRILSSGFQMHVSKPVDPIELLAVVASLANRSKL